MYLTYFYLRRIVTSKENMQPYIWVIPPLFQEASCWDLVFSRVLYFFEIRSFNRLCFQRYKIYFRCSNPLDKWPLFHYKRAVAATNSFKLTVFFHNRRSCSKKIYLSTIIPPWFQACTNWKTACYLATQIPAIHFFCGTVIVSWEHLKRSIISRALCLFRNTYCKHLL